MAALYNRLFQRCVHLHLRGVINPAMYLIADSGRLQSTTR
jgi:hypothetical protein